MKQGLVDPTQHWEQVSLNSYPQVCALYCPVKPAREVVEGKLRSYRITFPHSHIDGSPRRHTPPRLCWFACDLLSTERRHTIGVPDVSIATCATRRNRSFVVIGPTQLTVSFLLRSELWLPNWENFWWRRILDVRVRRSPVKGHQVQGNLANLVVESWGKICYSLELGYWVHKPVTWQLRTTLIPISRRCATIMGHLALLRTPRTINILSLLPSISQ